jgi:hypothetical protein
LQLLHPKKISMYVEDLAVYYCILSPSERGYRGLSLNQRDSGFWAGGLLQDLPVLMPWRSLAFLDYSLERH